jgi:hypothetical protein
MPWTIAASLGPDATGVGWVYQYVVRGAHDRADGAHRPHDHASFDRFGAHAAALHLVCKAYDITEVYGDKYAIGFHAAEWRSHGIKFTACERSTSENYLRVLPQLLARRVRLLDNTTLRNQLSSLERRVGAGDRETVSHPQHASAHDDVACACAGALAAAASRGSFDSSMNWVGSDATDLHAPYSDLELGRQLRYRELAMSFHAMRWQFPWR